MIKKKQYNDSSGIAMEEKPETTSSGHIIIAMGTNRNVQFGGKNIKNILKLGSRILFLATIHAKPLWVVANWRNHISITHWKTC